MSLHFFMDIPASSASASHLFKNCSWWLRWANKHQQYKNSSSNNSIIKGRGTSNESNKIWIHRCLTHTTSIYMFGGSIDCNNNTLSTIELYNTTTPNEGWRKKYQILWNTHKELIVVHCAHCAVTIGDEIFLIWEEQIIIMIHCLINVLYLIWYVFNSTPYLYPS